MLCPYGKSTVPREHRPKRKAWGAVPFLRQGTFAALNASKLHDGAHTPRESRRVRKSSPREGGVSYIKNQTRNDGALQRCMRFMSSCSN
jgi:hypothetical protein